ncbi:amino acid adenylation domain-containing protein, partial [Paucibacter sp. APW11]
MAITRVDRSRQAANELLLPLSWSQQRLWFLDRLDRAASAAYHMPAALRLSGPLDRSALKATLDRIVARHEILRTRFVLSDGQPMQLIADADDAGEPAAGFALVEADASDLAAQQAAFFAADFDLSAGPLIRGLLLRVAETEHVLLINQHHIISDGWSLGVLVREVTQLYAAFSAGQDDPLPPLAIQYADYAAWQRHWLQGERLQAQLDYWKGRLSGAPELLALPTDRPRPAQQSHAGATISFLLDAELTQRLNALGKRHGVTLYMTLLAAWALLMSRLSGQAEVVIGSPIANRQRGETEALIGFFANTLALRVSVGEAQTVAGLLAAVRQETLDAYAHQDLPFEQVVDAVKPQRSLGHSPLFQTMLTLNQGGAAAETLALAGLELAMLAQPQLTTQFDISLTVTEAENALGASIEYSTALFDEATVRRWLASFERVLCAMVDDETQTVNRVNLLSAEERHALLVGFNDSVVEFEQDVLVHELFERHARRRPATDAVRHEGLSISYGELDAASSRLAAWLAGKGAATGQRVAICARRGVPQLVAMLAVLKAGAAYVPLDVNYPAERLAHVLRDSAAALVLVDDGGAQALAATADLDGIHLVHLERDARQWAEITVDHSRRVRDPHQLAYVIYTSGSTGLPKGVAITHANVVNLIAVQAGLHGLNETDRVLQFASFGFDASVAEIFLALCHGATLVLRPEAVSLPDAAFAALLGEERITIADLPTAFWHQWAHELAAGRCVPAQMPRSIVVGGEAAKAYHLRQWLGHPATRNSSWANCYGPTEATVNCIAFQLGRGVQFEGAEVPIGRPLANSRVYILDAELQPVPLGVAGEIYIGGTQVGQGYLNRPELTAERFLRDPFAAEFGRGSDGAARMYKTGDLGRWRPDGTIEYLGRNDFQVKIRGFRIELGEIEARLMGCAGVREAVVLARADDGREPRLVAYVGADASLDMAAVRQQLARDLPEYMVPSAFVRLDAFALNASGKLDRAALPAPEASAGLARAFEAPQGEAETAIAAVWAELLKLDRVGRQDRFFELGGHSLLVIEMVERLRARRWHLEVQAVFMAGTVAALAAQAKAVDEVVITQAARIPAGCEQISPDMLTMVALTQPQIDAIVAGVEGGAANIEDIYPLAPLQEGILFHHLLEEHGDPYLTRKIVACASRADVEAFVAALDQVIARHESLRCGVFWEGLAEPVQVVFRHAVLPVQELKPEAGLDALQQLQAATDPRHLRLDLRRAPLAAVHLIEDAPQGRWLLAVLNHHLVSDHVALEYMMGEMQVIMQGRGEQLPAPLSIRDYIAQSRQVSAAEHRRWFAEQLGDVTEPTAPFGVLDTYGSGEAMAQSLCQLPAALSAQIRAESRALGVTPAVFFHLAWARVLAACTGQDRVVFGTVLSGRMRASAGIGQAVGMFINTLPICVRLDAASTVRASIDATYAQLSGVLAHEQASLALAQQCAGLAPGLPLFTTMFNFRHSEQSADSAKDIAWGQVHQLASEERTNYPFSAAVDDIGDGFILSVQSTSVPPERLLGYFEQAVIGLAQACAGAEETLMGGVHILPERERNELIGTFNETARPFPSEAALQQLFEAQVAQRPNALAIAFNGVELDYAELNGRANALAHALVARGVKAQALVAICLPRSVELIVAMLAVLKAGG